MKIDFAGLESYQTDHDKEYVRGIWIPFPGGKQINILRAGPGNKPYSRAIQSALRPYRRQLDSGTMDPDLAEDILRRIYARHIVKDWEGFNDDKGKPVPYTPEAGEQLFKALPQLFADIQAYSQDYSSFQMAQVEEAQEALGES